MKLLLTLKSQQRLSRVLAAWCLVFLVVLAGRPNFTNASLPVRGVADPVVALQMARNVEEVEAVIGDAPSADREVMRVKQYVDFGLIAGYSALGMLIAAAVYGTRHHRVGLLMGGLTILAAAADVREDIVTLQVVNLRLSGISSAQLDALRVASVTKWILLAAAVAQLASVTISRPRWYLQAAGFVGLVGAVLTLAGLFYNSILVWGGLLMFLALLVSAVTLEELTHESAS